MGVLGCIMGVLLVFPLTLVNSSVFNGDIDTGGLVYLGKFCFNEDPLDGIVGSANLVIDAGLSGTVTFAMFRDDGSWSDVYENSNCDCQCALRQAQHTHTLIKGHNDMTISVYGPDRPHFWFAALISCSSTGSQTFELTMTQESGSQFSLNENGLMPLYIVCTIVLLAGVSLYAYASDALSDPGPHPYVRLYLVSMLCWMGMAFSMMVHWAVFSQNGQGVHVLLGFGRVAEVGARITFALLLLLLAQGWAISTATIYNRRMVLGSLGLLGLAYVGLALWDLAARDPATTVYVYDSAPGIIVACINVFIAMWVMLRVTATLRIEEDPIRVKLYRIIGLVGAPYLLMLPFIVLVALWIPPWQRQRAVEAFVMACVLVWYALMAYLLRPSAIDYLTKDITPERASLIAAKTKGTASMIRSGGAGGAIVSPTVDAASADRRLARSISGGGWNEDDEL